MKNLHFYIQSIMVLTALCLAVQIPFQQELLFFVVMIEFFLGIYQLGMSFMLISRLTKKTNLLQIHLLSSVAYLLVLIVLGLSGPDWMDGYWPLVLFMLPWGLAILFLVTIDELERARHYRL